MPMEIIHYISLSSYSREEEIKPQMLTELDLECSIISFNDILENST